MYKRIVVPLDGSKLAEQALPHAVAQAEKFGAELVLLQVLEPLPDVSFSAPTAVRSAEQKSAELAREYLEGVAAMFRPRGIALRVEQTQGRPYAEIVRYADEQDADLIVMSTRGHSGISRWLLGSVADRVVRGATVPVLLVQCQDPCEA